MAEPQGNLVVPEDEQGAQDASQLPTQQTSEGSIPRLTIAPMEAGGLKDPVVVDMSTDDPVMGVQSETTSLAPAAEADVAAQQTGSSWEDVLSGKVDKIGDLKVTPALLNYAKKNAKGMVALRARWASTSQKQVPGEDVIIPFAREGQPVADQVVQDPMLIPAAERYAQNRVNLDNLVKQYVPDAAVRQIFVNKFETGDFYNSLETRLAEAGQFVATGIPMIGVMGYNAAGAYLDAKEKGTSFSEEWGARGTDIQRALDSTYNTIAKVLPNPTMKMAFNNDIHDEFKRQLADGEITEDQ